MYRMLLALALAIPTGLGAMFVWTLVTSVSAPTVRFAAAESNLALARPASGAQVPGTLAPNATPTSAAVVPTSLPGAATPTSDAVVPTSLPGAAAPTSTAVPTPMPAPTLAPTQATPRPQIPVQPGPAAAQPATAQPAPHPTVAPPKPPARIDATRGQGRGQAKAKHGR